MYALDPPLGMSGHTYTHTHIHTHRTTTVTLAAHARRGLIRNQLIGTIIGNHIQSEIIQEIKKAKFYTILADELLDISNKEQFSISFRYVLDCNVKEVLADFAEVERITGKVLAETIMNSLARWICHFRT